MTNKDTPAKIILFTLHNLFDVIFVNLSNNFRNYFKCV